VGNTSASGADARSSRKREGRLCAVCARRKSPGGQVDTYGFHTVLQALGIPWPADKAHRDCVEGATACRDRLVELRCQSKLGEQLRPADVKWLESIWKKYPTLYAAVGAEVFERTRPFGSVPALVCIHGNTSGCAYCPPRLSTDESSTDTESKS
jgi:hypothetical protein